MQRLLARPPLAPLMLSRAAQPPTLQRLNKAAVPVPSRRVPPQGTCQTFSLHSGAMAEVAAHSHFSNASLNHQLSLPLPDTCSQGALASMAASIPTAARPAKRRRLAVPASAAPAVFSAAGLSCSPSANSVAERLPRSPSALAHSRLVTSHSPRPLLAHQPPQPLSHSHLAHRTAHPAVTCAALPTSTSLPPQSTAVPPESALAAVRAARASTKRGPRPANPSNTTPSSSSAPGPTPPPVATGPWLIVGLGNPGSNYDRTRHNVGFAVLDALAASEGIDCRKLEKSAAVGRGELAGCPVVLAKPVTFMNNSGESVAALARFYKVAPTRMLVISDDLDNSTGVVKLKQRGGHGGHNGLRSIIERTGGNQDFPRIKIGIGRPSGQLPVASYVLQPFSKSEQAEVDVAIREAVNVVRSVLSLGLDKALSGVRC